MLLPSRAGSGDATIHKRFKEFFRIKAECVPVTAFAGHSTAVKRQKKLVKICNSPEKSPLVHVCVNDMTSGLSGWTGNFHQENQGTGCLVSLSRACAAGLGPFLQKQRLHNEPGVAMAKLAACCDRQGRQFAETETGICSRPSRMARPAPGCRGSI